MMPLALVIILLWFSTMLVAILFFQALSRKQIGFMAQKFGDFPI